MEPSYRYQAFSHIRRERVAKIVRAAIALRNPTRDALQAATGLSAASIAKYTQSLTEEHVLVAESAGVGRTLEYRVNPEFAEFVAVVVGRSVHAATVNAQGTITARSVRHVLPDDLLPEQFVRLVAQLVAPLVTERERAGARLLSCGVAIGGHIDPVGGISHDFYNREHWHRIALAQQIGAVLNVPTFLVNDANAATLGERYFGSARELSHFVLVWIGEGVGMGIFTNGELYTGASYDAGQLGHTVTPGNDRLCYCGAVGCLETVCSVRYALQRFRELVAQVSGMARIHPLGQQETSELADLTTLIARAQRGDRFAQRVFDEIADALEPKLIDVANLLNPTAIVLRGPLVDRNPHLVEALQQRVARAVLNTVADHLSIYSPGAQDDDSDSDTIIAAGVAAQAMLDFLDGSRYACANTL